MSARIFNLKQARKQKQRTEKDRAAEQNRAKFGRTKGEKQRDRLKTDRAVAHLDGHRIDKGNSNKTGNDDA